MPKNRKKIIRVASYNMGDGPDAEKLHDLNEFEENGTSLVGLQEHADRVDVTDRFVDNHKGWAKYDGDGRLGAAKICILYRKDLGQVKDKSSRTLVGKRTLAPGAGPEKADPKVSNRVKFKIGKKRVHFIVGHQYATVHRRRDAARLFLGALTDLIRQLTGIVIFVGDMNQQPKEALLHALRILLPVMAKTGPTHGNRTIDLIFVRGGQVLKAWTRKLSSDHRAVFADIEL